MNSDELKTIIEELSTVYQNLKAEIIVAEIQNNSKLTIDDIVINNKSTFRRSHRRDILDVSSEDDEVLQLNLSRNGLYDHLPEGLFHKKQSSTKQTNLSNLRKKQKKEEQEARHFFSPIENEFFYQKLKIEHKEQDLLNDFINLDDDFLINFWKVDKTIPKNYLLKLLKLLPFSYKIAGNLELTRLCLEKILHKKISFKKIEHIINRTQNKTKQVNQILGTGFTLSTNYNTLNFPAIEVEIGPIQEDTIDDYIKKDGIIKFINIFYSYFFPIEIEIITKFIVNHEQGFLLNKQQQPIMGVTTKI